MTPVPPPRYLVNLVVQLPVLFHTLDVTDKPNAQVNAFLETAPQRLLAV